MEICLTMLKDKNGKWVKILELTEDLWKKTIQEIPKGILRLLESAEKLLDNGGNEAICAGLYTYAVEEYGKLLLLKQYTPSAGKVKIEYKNGFLSHTKKFSLAIKYLPTECITLKKGAFDPKIFDPNVFDTKQLIADQEARMGVFYCDFLNSGNDIKPIPYVDKTLLKNAIQKLRFITLNT
jgi:AbiV family abortive infection protein